MPRTYVKKKNVSYTEDDMAKAVQAVVSNEMSMYAAAKMFGIPTTTLFDRMKGKSTNVNVGRPLAIPLSDEKRLAHILTIMEKWGFGLTRTEVLETVGQYVQKNELNTPFTNNQPGPDWFINFRKRHGLSIKKAQPVEYVRKKMTDPFVISEFFTLLENTLTELNLFEKPELVWNLDETSLCLDPTKTKVVGKINKPCSRTTYGTAKENITVLAAVNATGKKNSPLIVFKGKHMWDEWMAKSDDFDFEISYAASTKGWMETEIFYNYIDKILIPALGEERPVLLIYDGHSTHVDISVIELAIKNNITILKLPPHTSHLLQPLDLAVFKSFKTMWDRKLVDWQRHNVGKKMPKQIFSQTFGETWQATDIAVIQNGFKKSGIYPFNPNVIPEDKYDPAALKRFIDKKNSSTCSQAQPKYKNPKTLTTLCIDIFNTKNGITGSAQESSAPIVQESDFSATDVTLLTQSLKKDKQSTAFVANNTSALPQCLRVRDDSFKTNDVISDITTTFEELVLERLRQDKQDQTKIKKKRVAKGAEVITKSILKTNNEKEKLNNKKSQSTKAKSALPNSTSKSTDLIGNNLNSGIVCSSIKETSKRKLTSKKEPGKKQNRCSSISSISVLNDPQCNTNETIIGENFSDFDISWNDLDAMIMGDMDDVLNITAPNLSKNRNKENLQHDFMNIKHDTRYGNKDEDTTMDILDEKTGCIRTVVVTSAIVETPNPEKKCRKHLSKEKENFSNNVHLEQKLVTATRKRTKTQINKQKTKYKKHKKYKDSTTTSEEDIMSVHTDSDIEGIVISLTDDDEENEESVRKIVDETEAAIFSDIKRLDDLDKTAGDSQTKTERKGLNKQVNVDMKDCMNILTTIKKRINNETRQEDSPKTEKVDKLKKQKNNDEKGESILPQNEKTEALTYELGDTILARYYHNKKWKYYVGLITKIHNDLLGKKYEISFYKSVRKNSFLKFVKPKKADIDCLPVHLIVKEIDMLQIRENPDEFVLNDDEDKIYFLT